MYVKCMCTCREGDTAQQGLTEESQGCIEIIPREKVPISSKSN